MHPINKEWVTPNELTRDAAILRRQAKSLFGFGLRDAAAVLTGQAKLKEIRAAKLADADDLDASAYALEQARLPAAPSTTANPYGEVRA